MATRWLSTERAVLAPQAEVLPPGGKVEAGRGQASVSYLDSGVRRVFSLGRLKLDPTRLGWTVFVEDATYGNGHPLGPCAVWVRPPEKSQEDRVRESLRGERGGEDWENGYRRPTPGQALPARLVLDLARWVRPALAFVADRRDLGRLRLDRDVGSGGGALGRRGRQEERRGSVRSHLRQPRHRLAVAAGPTPVDALMVLDLQGRAGAAAPEGHGRFPGRARHPT
jgi:hypothetical protein